MPVTEQLRSTDTGGDVSVVPMCTFIHARSLGVAINEDIAVPPGAKHVLFSATGDFYAKIGGTAVVPVDVDDGSAAELNPTLRKLPKDTLLIGLISPSATVVTMCWYL